MVTFTLNNELKTVPDDNMTLLRYLRDVARLTSVKDGCSQGACGACMVLVDGGARKACAIRLARLEGCSVLTLEGFDPPERDLYARAFAACGAVQCGFCTPGMIISAKALLDKNPSPTEGDIRAAIRYNICRCTGYAKIIDAVMLIAAVKGGRAALPEPAADGALGQAAMRRDGLEKAEGSAIYADDIYMENMLYAAALRSAYPRAKVLAIHVSAARALPGVAAVLTAADVPGAYKIGHLVHDYPVMIGVGDTTAFLGDAIAIVAAESKQIAEAAIKLIEVEYQPLPPVLSIDQAMAADAPRVHSCGNLHHHDVFQRGDVDKALAQAAYVADNTYELPFTEHAFLEPECAIAWMEEGRVHIISADQGVYQTQKEVALMLGLAPEQVRVQAPYIGGGFGGKEDMSVQHHAALLAWHTGRPVKLKLSRDESILVHPKRHAMCIRVISACDGQGNLTAVRCRIDADTGAYASVGKLVLFRACTHASGPYHCPNVDIDGYAWSTNNPPAGAFRGFGVTQSVTATEANIDRLAALAGMDPWRFRWQNAVRPGERLPNGQLADADTALVQTLEAIKPFYDAHPGAGLSCAMKNSGYGGGVPDIGRARIQVEKGRAVVYCSASCIGQGVGTVLRQMVCDITGLAYDQVCHVAADTVLTPDCGNTTASRQTYFAGEAARAAARKLAAELSAVGGDLAALEGRSYDGEFTKPTDPMDTDKADPYYHVSYSYAAHCVALDEQGRVAAVAAAHDVGTAINPLNVQGQIEGGVVMGLGYALQERFPLENGRPKLKFGQLGLFTAPDTPEIIPIIVDNGLSREASSPSPAGGAKGVGELSAIPTAAAVLNAYYQRDGAPRTSLPLEQTPYSRK